MQKNIPRHSNDFSVIHVVCDELKKNTKISSYLDQRGSSARDLQLIYVPFDNHVVVFVAYSTVSELLDLYGTLLPWR